MSQQSIESIFSAEPISLIDLFEDKIDLGFRIPSYQRRYDWDGENIQRLFEDVLLGLSYRYKDENALTFLGTIILMEDREREERFNGTSFMVIDGQQRLTTLSLLACVLHEVLEGIELRVNSLEVIDKATRSWFISESENIRIRLYNLFCGELSGKARKKFPFPRIVREENDTRGKTIHDYEYMSAIASILHNFRNYVDKKEDNVRGSNFNFGDFNIGKSQSFENSIREIRECIDSILEEDEVDEVYQSLSVNFPDIKSLDKPGFRSLFDCLPNDDSKRKKQLSKAQKHIEILEPFLRLFLFSSFLLDKVIFTRIVVTDSKYGFDIFDSLNTTGEPLTAIQTFKPIVIRFEASERISNSYSKNYFDQIDNYLDMFEGKNNDRRQKAAKELVISFALYKTGERLSMSLNPQRRYLQQRYKKIDSVKGDIKNLKQLFVEDLFHVSDYRRRFWISDNIGKELSDYTEEEKEISRLCLRFLYDMKVSLTIPILCRFYRKTRDDSDKTIFIEALKALTAFVILRRSVTINTAGIDADFRNIMASGSIEKVKIKDDNSLGLLLGLDSSNSVPTITEFKEYLKGYLNQKKIAVKDKTSWISKVVNLPLYKISSHICRFIHIAAAHNSRIASDSNWRLSKKGSRESPETSYMTYSRWISNEVASAEHIAPQSLSSTSDQISSDWNEDIYIPDDSLKHTIGNLTLLSKNENSLLGNMKWEYKRFYFKAFSCKTMNELNAIIEKEKPKGLSISKSAEETIIENGKHRPLVESISSVELWNAQHIKDRSENICSLAWDEIAPWLFE